jgi:hypothetical protein
MANRDGASVCRDCAAAIAPAAGVLIVPNEPRGASFVLCRICVRAFHQRAADVLYRRTATMTRVISRSMGNHARL